MENNKNNSDNENININSNVRQLQVTTDSKYDKIKLPKRKFCIIHGYNGHKFSGNQKYEIFLILEILMYEQ